MTEIQSCRLHQEQETHIELFVWRGGYSDCLPYVWVRQGEEIDNLPPELKPECPGCVVKRIPLDAKGVHEALLVKAGYRLYWPVGQKGG